MCDFLVAFSMLRLGQLHHQLWRTQQQFRDVCSKLVT
jgi:hypothetical protein